MNIVTNNTHLPYVKQWVPESGQYLETGKFQPNFNSDDGCIHSFDY